MSTMAMGRQRPRQGEMLVTFDELPKSPGHVFYDRLQTVLADAGFDAFVEGLCQRYYAAVMGARALLPHASGRLFRGHRQRARPGVALRRQPVAAGLPRARAARPGARPFVAQPKPGAAAARGPRGRLRLGAGTP